MSAIEWTDKTVNVQIGCSRVSPGCEHCYAEKQANDMVRRFGKPGLSGHRYLPVVDGKGRWSREVVLDQRALNRLPHGSPPHGHGIPKRKRDGTGWRRPRVFLGSMTDHFHEKVTANMMCDVLDWMSFGPEVIWQIVTKRPERAAELLAKAGREVGDQNWSTVHLLATVEDQQRADERVPALLKAAPYVDLVGLSVEPLLGPVDISQWLRCGSCGYTKHDDDTHMDHNLCKDPTPRIGWVIVGGESGPGARPCAMEWILDVVGQCAAAGVPCFVKQLGARPTMIGRAWHKDDAKGGDQAEWPAMFQVRQWPA